MRASRTKERTFTSNASKKRLINERTYKEGGLSYEMPMPQTTAQQLFFKSMSRITA
jgi:hypothetical protein